MSGPQSKREASKKATELMADAAASKTCLRLPKNTLEAPAAIGTKCLAEAREAGDLLKLLGFAHCPIEEFNNCMFFMSLSTYVKANPTTRTQ